MRKKDSKPKFSNILLKRWLLKVGPVRRKTLLTKATRDDVAEGLKSKRKETRPLGDDRDDKYLRQESERVSNSLYNRKTVKTQRQDPSIARSDRRERRDSKYSLNKLEKVTSEVRESKNKCSGKSKKNKKRDRSRSRKNYRLSKQGANPNGIIWRLIPIEMEIPVGPPAPTLRQWHQMERKKKRDRLEAKFLDLFGEDSDDFDEDFSPKVNTKEIYKDPLPKKVIPRHNTTDRFEDDHFSPNVNTKEICKNPSHEKTGAQENRTACSKSPIFENPHRKQKRDTEIKDRSAKKLKSAHRDTRKDAFSTSIKMNRDVQERPNISLDNSPVADPTAAIGPLPRDQATASPNDIPVDRKPMIDDINTVASNAAFKANGDDEKTRKTEKDRIEGVTRQSRLNSAATVASPPRIEQAPIYRQQSVIVKAGKSCSARTSPTELDPKPQAKSVINEEVSLTSRIETKNSSHSGDNGSTHLAAVDNTGPQVPNLSQTLIFSCGKSIKNEAADQCDPAVSPTNLFEWDQPILPDERLLNIGSENSSNSINSKNFNIVENYPNPSSTTDMESGDASKSQIASSVDELLGALDNIYLALDCRRRIRERERTASKLAIIRNREEEVLKAKLEFDSKLIIFRKEIEYLCTKLDTWDQVLRFITQGLDHRTPSGMKPFGVVEIESVMHEAEIIAPVCTSEKKSAESSKTDSVQKILCTIDLTQDTEESITIDLCDSSTDRIVKPKIESGINGDVIADEIQKDSMSIEGVTTISRQQFEEFGNNCESVPFATNDPCYLCFRASLVACSRCAIATYCSKTCQLAHWKRAHHATCVPFEERSIFVKK